MGHSITDINRALDAARTDYVESCLRSNGWQLDSSLRVPELEPPPLNASVLEQFILQIIFLTEPGTPRSNEPADQEYAQAAAGCWEQAFEEVEDPTGPLVKWISLQERQLGPEVSGDRRISDAWAEVTGCIRDAGYPFGTTSDFQVHIFERGAEIYEAYARGEMSSDRALDELRGLQSQEQVAWASFGPCVARALEVQQTVRVEAEIEFLAENSDALALVASQVSAELGPLATYLAELDER